MKLSIFGKAGCAKCDAAKAKLELLGLPYDFHLLEQPGPDWRESGHAVAMAWYHWRGGELPVVVVDGEPMSYPKAMKRLKARASHSQ